jgi:uncharacterized MnhB-related membrane protein
MSLCLSAGTSALSLALSAVLRSPTVELSSTSRVIFAPDVALTWIVFGAMVRPN